MTNAEPIVNFMIAGTQKGGTTALAEFLSQHPEVVMSKEKEAHFFDNEGLFETAIDYSIYHRLFNLNTERSVPVVSVGEATPIYMYWKPAVSRIAQYNAKMKFVFVLRDPVDRAYSQYIMEKRRGAENRSFLQAVLLEKYRARESRPLQHRVYSYLDRGFYARQIASMLDYFPLSQMLFLKTEDMRSMHGETLRMVFSFLHIDADVEVPSRLVFSKQYSPVGRVLRTFLSFYFSLDVMRLQRITGLDCRSWLPWCSQR